MELRKFVLRLLNLAVAKQLAGGNKVVVQGCNEMVRGAKIDGPEVLKIGLSIKKQFFDPTKASIGAKKGPTFFSGRPSFSNNFSLIQSCRAGKMLSNGPDIVQIGSQNCLFQILTN